MNHTHPRTFDEHQILSLQQHSQSWHVLLDWTFVISTNDKVLDVTTIVFESNCLGEFIILKLMCGFPLKLEVYSLPCDSEELGWRPLFLSEEWRVLVECIVLFDTMVCRCHSLWPFEEIEGVACFLPVEGASIEKNKIYIFGNGSMMAI